MSSITALPGLTAMATMSETVDDAPKTINPRPAGQAILTLVVDASEGMPLAMGTACREHQARVATGGSCTVLAKSKKTMGFYV